MNIFILSFSLNIISTFVLCAQFTIWLCAAQHLAQLDDRVLEKLRLGIEGLLIQDLPPVESVLCP